jgi:hypothetical protein
MIQSGNKKNAPKDEIHWSILSENQVFKYLLRVFNPEIKTGCHKSRNDRSEFIINARD